MSVRSLNKVQLIGNLTRDPELRYTSTGTAVCSFGLATNRSWTTDAGERKEDTEFHRIVSWNKLAEICSQLLAKGRKVYVEGRLQTRQWQTADGQPRQTTEIVIDDMIVLDSKYSRSSDKSDYDQSGGGYGDDAAKADDTDDTANDDSQKADDQAGDDDAVTGKSSKKPKTSKAQSAQTKSANDKSDSKTESDKDNKKSATGGNEEINPDDIPF